MQNIDEYAGLTKDSGKYPRTNDGSPNKPFITHLLVTFSEVYKIDTTNKKNNNGKDSSKVAGSTILFSSSGEVLCCFPFRIVHFHKIQALFFFQQK